MICNNCKYIWSARTASPVACPRCKYRLDWPKQTKQDQPEKVD